MRLAFNFLGLMALAPMLLVNTAPIDGAALAARDADLTRLEYLQSYPDYQQSYARDISARGAQPVPSLDNTERVKREAEPRFAAAYADYYEYVPPSKPAK